MTGTLPHVSESVLDQLRDDVPKNVARYTGDGFRDLAREQGWAIIAKIPVDLDCLSELDGSERTAQADLKNTRIIWQALGKLTPSLANEEQIWVRLSHVEAFAYTQRRWLRNPADADAVAKDVVTHFFAPGQTGIRDDHAISRLWWNGFVARHCYPEDPDKALGYLLSSADVRSNLVERIWLTSRRKLTNGLFRLMDTTPWVLSSEANFRSLMKTLNLRGAGVVFEAMSQAGIDEFLKACVESAREKVS